MKEQNPLVFLFRMMWRFSENNRKNIVIYQLFFITAQSIHLFGQPLLAAHMMDIIQKQGINNESLHSLAFILGLMLGIDFLFWVFHGPARVLEEYNAFIVRMNYRAYLIHGFMNLPIGWHVDHHSGDTIDKIEKGTNALCDFTAETSDIIYSAIRLMVGFGVLTYFSPLAASVALGFVVVNIALTMRFDRILVKQYKQLSKMENSIGASINDAICNIRTVIILRVEQLIFKTIMHQVKEPYDLYKKNTVLNEIKWFSTSQFCKLMIVVSLGIYFYQHHGTKGGILVSSVYLLGNYLDNLGDLFFRFAHMYGQVLRRAAKVRNAEELSKDFLLINNTKHVLPEDWKELTIKGLTFSYAPAQDAEVCMHLDNVSLTLRKGEKIAVVGESGGGKSTFLSLMRDLYRPSELTLSVDGYQIIEGFPGVCDTISLMPQDPEIFATTMRKNITMGAEGYSYHDIVKAMDMACFTEVLPKLPDGLESSVNEKG